MTQVRTSTRRIAAEYIALAPEQVRALESDLKSALACPVDFGSQARAMFATDASNYRQVPIGLVLPKTSDDVIEALRICRVHDAPIIARGGGTSLAGQGCNVAVMFDFSRYMTRLIELNPSSRIARVEPGCILDHLRNGAEEHHLTFGPDPATHDRNTLGGMIGNNSCGVHSIMSGRTSDYVARLTVLTYDGALLDVGPTDEAELREILAGGGRRADIYRQLLGLRDRYGRLIEERFPQIPRRVSGFENLDELLSGRDFNVARMLTGTEGSCVLILDATVQLVPSPACRALTLLGFDDVYAAGDAVPEILKHGPIALEGFDDLLHHYLSSGNIDHRGLELFPPGKGWLIVETGGDTAEEAKAKAEEIAEAMTAKAQAATVTDPHQQKQVWIIRESALGVSSFVPGEAESWPGWEDSAVPPDRLGDYLRDLRALMDRYGYRGAYYGHFGDGLLHLNIDFDFHDEKGIAGFRDFTREAADLVHSYGGSLSGEHGDGEARADLLERMYGPELVECFREFKAIWDPGNRMNPGKAIEPFPRDSNLRLGPDYRPADLSTHFAFEKDHGSFAHAVKRCVGVGKCRRRNPGDEVMCPSYLVTLEEKHSTRGRAHLLHEMVRGDVITDGWDSREVEDALSLCLACKGCRSDCPVAVDVATYKAEFRAHHYARRSRPRSAVSMGLIHRWARLAEPVPWLANLFTRAPALSALSKRISGVHPQAQLPPMRRSFRRWFMSRERARQGGEPVLLWPDTFNNHFRPETAIAATRVLESAGYEVSIPKRPLCCGRALYDWGYLKRAKALWEDTFDCLRDAIAAGTAVIGLEPACTSAFKDELPNLFPKSERARRLSSQMVHFTDFIADHWDRLPEPRRAGRAIVQPHCHHHAVLGFDSELDLLARLEIDAERPQQGCCGMAGAFGLASETYEVAKAIGERELLPKVRSAPDDTLIIADGFSCREQIEQNSGRVTTHIAELLARRMLSDV